MMRDGMLVSIIMPAYNAAGLIAEGIASVLAQEHRPLEVIVIDDGSTDESAAVAEQFGGVVSCHRQANAGPSAARNRGLALARGEIVGFLDADDLYTADKLAKQMGRLNTNPGVEIVLGRLQYFELTGDGSPGSVFALMKTMADDYMSLQLGCGLFRRSVFERIGLFNETLRQSEDLDWFMRAREQDAGLLLHRDIVLKQRLHTGNVTRQREIVRHGQMVMFKKAFDRRRAAGKEAVSLRPLESFLEPELPEEDVSR